MVQILKTDTGPFCSFLWHVYFVCIYSREPNKSCVSPSRGGKGGLGCCRPVKIPKDCSHLLNFESSEKLKARYNITSFNESTMKRNADLISNIEKNRRIGFRIDQILFLDLGLSRPLLNSVSFCESGAAQRGQKKMF